MRENSPRSKKKQNKAMSAGMRFAAGLLVTLFVFNALSLPAFTEEIPESPPDDGYEYVLTDTEVSPEGAEVEEDSPEEGTEGNTEGIQDSTEGIDGAKDVPFSPEATENIPE
ncbi:MAG: hypothetical protein LBL25_00530, partial [Oscillospiraceae bacterium]|nr:hypothetical protein [Oscillospiraceae bacterium]